jgi:archaellum component FlaC
MNISEQLSKLTVIQSPNMKPFPEQEVNAIEHEMCDLRDEVSKLRIQLENAQNCLNALYQKRQNLITDAREGNLFEQMFGTDTPMAEEVYGG